MLGSMEMNVDVKVCRNKKKRNRKVALLKQRFLTRCNCMAVSDTVCVI